MKHKLLTGSLSFTVGMGFSVLPAVAQQSPASTEVKPNVIIINVDDLGYGDIGCYGATKVKTPNIDRLASQGRSFMDAHSSSAVSTPSRYGLMTGQYPCREDIWGAIFLNQTLQIDTARTTIADVMKRSGYSTAIVGKWHLGFRTESKMPLPHDGSGIAGTFHHIRNCGACRINLQSLIQEDCPPNILTARILTGHQSIT